MNKVLVIALFISASAHAQGTIKRGPAIQEAQGPTPMEQLCNNLVSHRASANSNYRKFVELYEENCPLQNATVLHHSGQPFTCQQLSKEINMSLERANLANTSLKKYCP